MSSKSIFHINSISYSFRQRGDLPGEMGRLYLDAGLARDAFEEMRSDLPAPKIAPVDRKTSSMNSGKPNRWKEPNADLPAPHPISVVPSRCLEDRNWREARRTKNYETHMTRAEFNASRREAIPSKPRPRFRNKIGR